MTLFGYGFYAALTTAAVSSIFFAYHLQNQYKLKYLSDFFHYLIAITIYWFIVLIVPGLLYSILSETFADASFTMDWLFVLFSYPCLLLGLFLFLAFFIHLRTERIPVLVPWVFIITMVLFGIGLGISIKLSMDNNNNQIISTYYVFLRIISFIIRYGAIAFAFIGSFQVKDDHRKRLTQVLCGYFFMCFAFYNFLLSRIPVSEDVSIYLNASVYLVINVLPLFYIRGFLERNFKQQFLHLQSDINFESISTKFELTNREKEVFLLMMKGKSNKEIGEELYISAKTARNHTSNIFRKFGVNNRTKFFVFVSNLAGNRARL